MARKSASVNTEKIPAEAKAKGSINVRNDERADKPQEDVPVVENPVKDENDIFPPQSYRQDRVMIIHGKQHIFRQTVHHH